MLLNHSAGYKRQPDPEGAARRLGVPVRRVREPELVRCYWDHPLDFRPGSEPHYSNFGYTVLGAIVGQVVDEPYGPAVHRLVIGPMGIRKPRLGHGEPYGPEMAHRFDFEGREMPPIDLPGRSAGGWIASTVDMVRLLAAIDGSGGHRPAFLDEATRLAMFAPPEPPLKKRPNGNRFGLGWDIVHESPQGPTYAK